MHLPAFLGVERKAFGRRAAVLPKHDVVGVCVGAGGLETQNAALEVQGAVLQDLLALEADLSRLAHVLTQGVGPLGLQALQQAQLAARRNGLNGPCFCGQAAGLDAQVFLRCELVVGAAGFKNQVAGACQGSGVKSQVGGVGPLANATGVALSQGGRGQQLKAAFADIH